MERSATAFWITNPGAGALRQEPLPKASDGQVQIRSLHSAVSRGTEGLVFRGQVPESQYAVMRCPFQVGDFPGPVKYGYASVGLIEAGPTDLVGRLAFALHPHQDRYVLPAEAALPLPPEVPPGRAVLAANMETALNALWDAAPAPDTDITVIGAGAVGCLFAWLAVHQANCRVQLVDIDPDKADLAHALGAHFAAPETAASEAELVVHTSGAPAGLVTALALAGFEATIWELSWFGDRQVSLPLGEDFHSKRLSIRSSQVGHVAPVRRAVWSRRRRLAAALGLLAAPELDRLITGSTPFAELPETMAWLAGGPPGVICHRIDYD
ncbi:MAG: zinc-binding alcohol dehydrogenase [Pseudomonadota bacterium]